MEKFLLFSQLLCFFSFFLLLIPFMKRVLQKNPFFIFILVFFPFLFLTQSQMKGKHRHQIKEQTFFYIFLILFTTIEMFSLFLNFWWILISFVRKFWAVFHFPHPLQLFFYVYIFPQIMKKYRKVLFVCLLQDRNCFYLMSFSLEICASVILQMDSEMNIRFLCVNVEANGGYSWNSTFWAIFWKFYLNRCLNIYE